MNNESKVINFHEHHGSNRTWTPAQMLDAVRADLESGALPAGVKVLVVTLDDSDGAYNTTFYACRLKGSAMVSLAAMFQQKVMRMMGY